jgi:hypothetical protein
LEEQRKALIEGRVDLPAVGDVIASGKRLPPFVLRDAAGVEVEAVTR